MGRKWVVIAGLNFLLLSVRECISDCLTALIMLVMSILLILVTGILQTMRSELRDITGGDFQDDQWGFGQIIAVFLWIPLCLQVVYCVTSFA